MATEKLNPNAWDSGWPTGFVTNVDEPIASADGSTVSTFTLNDIVIFSLTNVTTIQDIDTVTAVTITVRSMATDANVSEPGDPQLNVELLIGGVSQGSDTIFLSSSFNNEIFSHANWNQDWTVAQLNGAQVRVTSAGSLVDTWFIDAIDVDVTYTPLPPHVALPLVRSLALSREDVIADTTSSFVTENPLLRELDLAGKIPVVARGINVPHRDVQLAGKPSYLNSLQLQLQVNGWDNGWPTGFVTNVDEPSATADGQTVSTSVNNDVATFNFTDVTGTIVDLDEVLSITMVVRARDDHSEDFPEPEEPAALNVDLLINGSVVGTPPQQITLSNSMANYSLPFVATSGWNVDRTVAELNSLQVRLTANNFGRATTIYLDAIDVIVEYVHQSPIVVFPATKALALARHAPSLRDLRYEQPQLGSLALTRYAPTLQRADRVYPSKRSLLFAKYVPQRIGALFRPTLVGTVLIGEKTTVALVNHIAAPVVRTLVLAGQAPTVTTTASKVRLPGRAQLLLSSEAPVVPTTNNEFVIPPRGVLAAAGKVPTVAVTRSVWSTPAVRTLTLTRYAPSRVGSKLMTPAVRALLLTERTPNAEPGRSVLPGAGALTIASVPQLGGLQAELSLTAYAPSRVIGSTELPGRLALTLTGAAPNSLASATAPDLERLVFLGFAPTLSFTSALTPGQPGLISLTVDRDIEHIATPTIILIE